MNITFNNLETNFLLFSATSLFHYSGVCIYKFNSDIKRHDLKFKKVKFDDVHVDYIDEILKYTSPELKEKISIIKNDAVETAKKYIISAGREGMMIGHKNLNAEMTPHIHRHAYDIKHLPSLTIHYNLGPDLTYFKIFDPIDRNFSLEHDLCLNEEITKLHKNKEPTIIELKKNKNIFVFDAAQVPHCITLTDSINFYFVFDHVELIDPTLFREGSINILDD